MRALLQPRIDALAEAHAATIARKAAASPSAIDAARPLAILVAECEARRGADIEDDAGHAGAPAIEHPQVPALQPARELWKAVRTERQLRQSLQKPHEDTGPLNSAQLVNRMLLRMGEASPGFLEHFIGYVDVLSELEHLFGPVAVADPSLPMSGRRPAAKRARAPRKRKD